ncbi:MAG: hypothetical protein ACOXZR_00930 [Bacilli bacterium]|jgi:hypothetical protein
MDEILIFLSENYFYVIGIGLVLIFILIGFLSSRKGAKNKNQNIEQETMANINEVNTGEIDQVAEQLNKQNEGNVERISEVEEDAFKVNEEPAIAVNAEHFQPEEEVFSKMEPIEISEIPNKEEVSNVGEVAPPLEEPVSSMEEIENLDGSFEFKPEEPVLKSPSETYQTADALNMSNEVENQINDIQSFDYVTDKSSETLDDNILVGEETINIEEEK